MLINDSEVLTTHGYTPVGSATEAFFFMKSFFLQVVLCGWCFLRLSSIYEYKKREAWREDFLSSLWFADL
jgi:hypothetical protein